MPFELNGLLRFQKFDFLDLTIRQIQNGLDPVTPGCYHVVKYHGDKKSISVSGNRVKSNWLPICPECSATPAHAVAMTEWNPRKKIVWPVKTCYFSRKKKLVMPWKLPAFAMTLVATVPTTSTAIIQWNKSCQYFFFTRERDKNWWERYNIVWRTRNMEFLAIQFKWVNLKGIPYSGFSKQYYTFPINFCPLL